MSHHSYGTGNSATPGEHSLYLRYYLYRYNLLLLIPNSRAAERVKLKMCQVGSASLLETPILSTQVSRPPVKFKGPGQGSYSPGLLPYP